MSLQAPPPNFVAFFYPELVDFVQRINRTPGNVRFTSWWRSWEDNLRVGGSTIPLSQHLAGLAVDLVPAPPSTAGGIVRALQNQGLYAVDEGTHVHAQYWPRGGLNRRLGVPI